MSTKAIRRFLNLYGESREGVLQSPLGRDALAEVEAIEAAATPIAEKVRLSDIVHEMPDHCPMMLTLPAGVWRALVKAVES